MSELTDHDVCHIESEISQVIEVLLAFSWRHPTVIGAVARLNHLLEDRES